MNFQNLLPPSELICVISKRCCLIWNTQQVFPLAFNVSLTVLIFLLLHFMLFSIFIFQKLFYFSDVASGVFSVCFTVWAFYLLFFLLDFEASGAVFGRHTHSFGQKPSTLLSILWSLSLPVYQNRPKPIKCLQFTGLFCAMFFSKFWIANKDIAHYSSSQ